MKVFAIRETTVAVFPYMTNSSRLRASDDTLNNQLSTEFNPFFCYIFDSLCTAHLFDVIFYNVHEWKHSDCVNNYDFTKSCLENETDYNSTIQLVAACYLCVQRDLCCKNKQSKDKRPRLYQQNVYISFRLEV